ncbi:MAG: hypothetical protein ACFFAO_18360 [Candidatus Hermodarchaeota archaeon]
MRVSEATFLEIEKIDKRIRKIITDNEPSLESAAMKFVSEIYDNFEDSIILLRLFLTLPYNELPKETQAFADILAQSVNLKLEPNSYLLTLFGTIGKENEWLNIKDSRGHQAIPLPTPDFVSAIPMMSALMEQMGFQLGWKRGEPEIVAQHIDGMMGSFYVKDAVSGEDSRGRKIIVAQDFINKYGVKSVFGIGGGRIKGGKIITVICFINETIERKQAILFQPLAVTFRILTDNLINNKKYF